MGRTKVFLHDKNVREEYSVILPSATVNVHDVVKISLSVLPNRNWGLILGHTHEIIVELYDRYVYFLFHYFCILDLFLYNSYCIAIYVNCSKDHKFYIGEGVDVSMKIDEQYFESKFITQNGTYAVGIPIICGTMTVEATLRGIIDERGRKITSVRQLFTTAELLIHEPVKVQPRVLAIPWDAANRSR